GDLTARLGYRPGGPLAAVLTTDSFVKDEGVPGAGSVQARDAQLRTLRQLAHLDVKLTPLGGLPLDADASGYFLYDRPAFIDRRGEVSFVPVDHTDTTTAGGVQALFRSAIGTHQVPGLLLAASDERFASPDRLDPAGNAPDRSRLRTTLAAEDEVLLAADRLSIVPGLRWEVFRDDFPGTPRLPVAARASGVSVRDFLSPRLGLRVEPVRGLTFLANLGRYAREPNLEELFGTRGVVIGNPSLRPEVAFNRDARFHLAVPGRGPLPGAARAARRRGARAPRARLVADPATAPRPSDGGALARAALLRGERDRRRLPRPRQRPARLEPCPARGGPGARAAGPRRAPDARGEERRRRPDARRARLPAAGAGAVRHRVVRLRRAGRGGRTLGSWEECHLMRAPTAGQLEAPERLATAGRR